MGFTEWLWSICWLPKWAWAIMNTLSYSSEQCLHAVQARSSWYVRVEDRNVLTLMLKKELVVFLLMWFWIRAKHIFFRNPQHKQNQSPAVTQTTSEVELRDYTLYLSVSIHNLIYKDHEYSLYTELRYNLSSFSDRIFQNGNDVRFHYYCHMPYESYHFWMRDLPLLVASGTSVHLLWWALPVVGFTLCVWSKQIHTIHTHTHTHTHAHGQPQVGPQCDVNNRLLLLNEQTPSRAYSQLLITCATTPPWTWCPSSPRALWVPQSWWLL